MCLFFANKKKIKIFENLIWEKKLILYLFIFFFSVTFFAKMIGKLAIIITADTGCLPLYCYYRCFYQ